MLDTVLFFIISFNLLLHQNCKHYHCPYMSFIAKKPRTQSCDSSIAQGLFRLWTSHHILHICGFVSLHNAPQLHWTSSTWLFGLSELYILFAWNMLSSHLLNFWPLLPPHLISSSDKFLFIPQEYLIYSFKSFRVILCTRNQEGSKEQEKHSPYSHRTDSLSK